MEVDLTKLFSPRSVAVIGASQDPGKAGGIIMKNLLEHGYPGKIYPINPGRDEVMGIKAYPSVRDVSDEIDVAIISIPAPRVLQTVEECVAKRVKFGIIIAAGFGEAGPEGVELQRKIVEIARRGGMRLTGPNTIGVINAIGNFIGSAVPFKRWRKGGISIMCQTGVFAGAVADWVMDNELMGIGKVAAVGNKCDLDEADFLKYFGSDPETKVIGFYIEDFSDGRRFVQLAKEISRNKPIVVVKSGRTSEGAKAALSHTGALAIDDRVVDAALKQCGVIRADTMGELLAYLKSFEYQPLPKGNRIGIITLSGAMGVMTVDLCSQHGLRLAPLSEEIKREIESKIMPPWQPAGNPVDIWISLGYGPDKAHSVALEALLKDDNVDAVLAILLALPPTYHDVKAVFGEAIKKYPEKPVIVSIVGGRRISEEWFRALEELGIPCFLGPNSPEMAAKTISAMYRYSQYLKKAEELAKASS